MVSRAAPFVLAALLGACAIPDTIDALGDRSPAPEFGRPAWVRVPAGIGAWLGGIAGGAVSVVLLPIHWPLSRLARDGLGEQGAAEFLFWPATAGASIGHAALGLPFDAVDYLGRRAWGDSSPPVTQPVFERSPGLALPADGGVRGR
jgi:hypothetical protein